MIAADTSALIAILGGEPAAEECLRALVDADAVALSAANLLEAGVVAEGRFGSDGGHELDRLLLTHAVEIVPVDAGQANLARYAYRSYGKGHHPAGLNFGDCFSYALAMTLAVPLLFVGNDFRQTDVEAVLA